MNIKRMAKAYRETILATGRDVKGEFPRVYGEGENAAYSISFLQYRLGSWKACLKRAGIEDLNLLESSWETVCQVNYDVRLGKKNYWDRKVTTDHVSKIRIAEKKLNEFLKVLPELLEQALTKAVRESGIRL